MSGLGFAPDDVRLRVLSSGPAPAGAEYVLYWMQMYRRADDNAALAYAVQEANRLGLPCVVYEALRPDYPHASDRFHTFVLEGAKDVARGLQRRGLYHAFFLPKTASLARGVVAKLAKRAALVVSDDFPSFVIPAHNRAAASHIACPFVVVDDAAVVPLALFPKQETAARTLRPKMKKHLGEWLLPLEEPPPRVSAPARLELPFDALDLEKVVVPDVVLACDVDHAVPAVPESPGGSGEASARLDRFLKRRLSSYALDRNDPTHEGTSQLSPYLHFGHISARRVALAARAQAGDASEGADAFLEQLLVRRGLAYNFARARPDHATYAALPDWSRRTLAEHSTDPRPAIVSAGELEAAQSPDPLWNAAQLELRARGVVQSYARMLWGKLPLTWTKTPEEAHALLVRLNDRYALDGRDPDGYANISWCFGLHDRPWPKRAIYGAVRTMTSRSARSKLDFEAYIDGARRWRDEIP